MSVIIDRNAGESVFSALDRLKISYYKSFDMKKPYFPVNTHPDMQIHFISGRTAVVAPCAYEYYRSILPHTVTLEKGFADPGDTYPHDAAYNIVKMGKNIIGNISFIDLKLKEIYTGLGFRFINVKQGYTKCSTCVVGSNSAITEDEGIYKTLKNEGMNILRLSRGGVTLKGFDYGFIGGASGFIKKSVLAFSGNVELHPEADLIKNFLKENKVDIIYLSSTKLSDIGSILYFDESTDRQAT